MTAATVIRCPQCDGVVAEQEPQRYIIRNGGRVITLTQGTTTCARMRIVGRTAEGRLHYERCSGVITLT